MTHTELVAKRTRLLMKERNWTMYKLANQSAVPFSTLDYVLNGRGKTVTLETVINLCRGFNIRVVDFFNDDLFEPENISDDD